MNIVEVHKPAASIAIGDILPGNCYRLCGRVYKRHQTVGGLALMCGSDLHLGTVVYLDAQAVVTPINPDHIKVVIDETGGEGK